MKKTWTVLIPNKVEKQGKKLPDNVCDILDLLFHDLKHKGPELKGWPNYGKIKGKKDIYHCHLNKGKPRYVAVWKILNKTIYLLEVRYVGTHENANYKRID